MPEEKLFEPVWREDWTDTHYLLPEQQQVWDVARDTLRYQFTEKFGSEIPMAYAGTRNNPYYFLPQKVAWNTGIGPPDNLVSEGPGETFMKKLTQIRVPILFRSRQVELELLQRIISTLITKGGTLGWIKNLTQFLRETTYTFIYPAPYAGPDVASKYRTIIRWFENWKEDIPYQLNYYASKIVCFRADSAVKEQLRKDVHSILGLPAAYDDPLVLEFPAPDGFWESYEY